MPEVPRPHIDQRLASVGAAPRLRAGAERSPSPSQVDRLLAEAEQALLPDSELNSPGDPAAPFIWQDLAGETSAAAGSNLDLIGDVELDLKIELGRTRMVLEDVVKLRRGTVVPLDKLVGEPVDILAGGQLIARGEVVVLNGNFATRIIELIAPNEPASPDTASR
jgi:flagellar motor switch protein FliN